MNEYLFNEPYKAYAAWSTREDDINKSSSGGMATVFARRVIDSNGIVCGSAVKEKRVQHIFVDNIEGLDAFRGSKYVQSRIDGVFPKILELLQKGKKVLFVGTPCQVAGLKLYMGAEDDNLVTIDLICHGTPDEKMLIEHIDNKLKGKKWDSYSFRGRNDWYLSVYCGEEVVYKEYRDIDEYFCAFLSNMSFQERCYTCKYAQNKRVSDITIGDFWGLDRSKLNENYKGRVSVVLINTEKGNNFFDSCKSDIKWQEFLVKDAINKEQWNLMYPSRKHNERDVFLQNYEKVGFDKAVRKTDFWKKKRKEWVNLQIKRSLPMRGMRKIKRLLVGRFRCI